MAIPVQDDIWNYLRKYLFRLLFALDSQSLLDPTLDIPFDLHVTHRFVTSTAALFRKQTTRHDFRLSWSEEILWEEMSLSELIEVSDVDFVRSSRKSSARHRKTDTLYVTLKGKSTAMISGHLIRCNRDRK